MSMNKITIGKFNLDYENIASEIITPVIKNKPKNFYIKSFWDNDFNRGYIINKINKHGNTIKVLKWIPKVNGAIKLPKEFPMYIEELLYEIYNFEFPNGSEKKDITLKSFYSSVNNNYYYKIYACLLKVKAESIMGKQLDLIGPCGLYSNCQLMDMNDNFVTKMFRVDNEFISFNTGQKREVVQGSIDELNGGAMIFQEINCTEKIFENLKILS